MKQIRFHGFYLLLLLIFFGFLSEGNLDAQNIISLDTILESPKVSEVVEVISGDSVQMYYNENYEMVTPDCYKIVRRIRIDSTNGSFNGIFSDFYKDGQLAVKGRYIQGRKEGDFVVYYPNGQVFSSGSYVNNCKTGYWNYFYENGKPQMTLGFVEGDTSIMEFWNSAGAKKVKLGKGRFSMIEQTDLYYKIHGKVLNGKKSGYWKKTLLGNDYDINLEDYEDGKLIAGWYNPIIGPSTSYTNTVYCFIEKQPKFINAELFLFSHCMLTYIKEATAPRFVAGMDVLIKQISDKLQTSLCFQKQQTKSLIIIDFIVDENGNLSNFEKGSDVLCGFEDMIIDLMKQIGGWEPATYNGKAVAQEFKLRLLINK